MVVFAVLETEKRELQEKLVQSDEDRKTALQKEADTSKKVRRLTRL